MPDMHAGIMRVLAIIVNTPIEELRFAGLPFSGSSWDDVDLDNNHDIE